MVSDDPRKSYWDSSYLAYWRARVAEAGGAGSSRVIKGDALTEDDRIYDEVLSSGQLVGDNVLDVGCAWGRLFPLFVSRSLRVSGVDISPAMIAAAREEWGSHPLVEDLVEGIAEELPFPGEAFDNVVCVATFDATYQHQALKEFLRVTRPGGRILLTGKHTDYCLDDAKAYNAEVAARSKGHPNYFTRTEELIQLLKEQGHSIVVSYFFRRRGDFASGTYTTRLLPCFYEYLLIIERGSDYREMPPFSDLFSRTYQKLHGTDE